MKKWKKIILVTTGPGILIFVMIVLFIHLFTPADTSNWIVVGLIPFFIVFIPFYMVEYFRDETRKEKQDKKIQFKKRKTRTEWEGGNIHGKIPTQTKRPGNLFN